LEGPFGGTCFWETDLLSRCRRDFCWEDNRVVSLSHRERFNCEFGDACRTSRLCVFLSSVTRRWVSAIQPAPPTYSSSSRSAQSTYSKTAKSHCSCIWTNQNLANVVECAPAGCQASPGARRHAQGRPRLLTMMINIQFALRGNALCSRKTIAQAWKRSKRRVEVLRLA
jgi:hypothetical protein